MTRLKLVKQCAGIRDYTAAMKKREQMASLFPPPQFRVRRTSQLPPRRPRGLKHRIHIVRVYRVLA